MRRERNYSVRPHRHTVLAPCRVVRASDGRVVATRIENLSTWGMLVGPAAPVLTGEPVIVSLRLPGSDTRLHVRASVARVLHGRRPQDSGYRKLGLRFEDLRPEEILALRRALRSPVAPPGPRPGRRLGLSITALAA